MKSIVRLIIAVLLALAVAAPTFAHQLGPCGDASEPGHSDFAKHHIVPLAQAGRLGADEDEHRPGEHHGFSVCNPPVSN